jgi:predicted MarR family transcription regulator
MWFGAQPINHRSRENKLADSAFILNIEDNPRRQLSTKETAGARRGEDREARQGSALFHQ